MHHLFFPTRGAGNDTDPNIERPVLMHENPTENTDRVKSNSGKEPDHHRVVLGDKLDADIWGPHFWFVLHTLAYCYPDFPTDHTRRKYYDLVTNLPLFIPVPKMGDEFAVMLDDFPVSPYLANRESFLRWMNFVHNKYNERTGKPAVPLHLALQQYLAQYTKNAIHSYHHDKRYVVRVLYLVSCIFCLCAIFYLCFGSGYIRVKKV